MVDSKRVLITGAGGSIAVNLTRSLQMSSEKWKLYGCDANPYFIHLALTEETERIPSASNETAYLSAITNLVQKWKIDLIFPSNLSEILVLSKNRKSLGAKLFLPSHEAIETGADKWGTFERLTAKKLPLPRTLLMERKEDVEDAFKQFGSPVWFRGRGVPGRGVGVASLPARDQSQAMGWIEFHKAWGNMTASEYLPGDNLTWMGLWKEGELISSQGRKRLAYVISHVSPSGITGAPSVSVTVHDEFLNDIGAKAMLALDPTYNGVGFVDFKSDKAGHPKITEVNVGRFGTTHHFYTVAGANFPSWYVQLALDQPVQDVRKTNILPKDLYWIRSLDAGPVLKSQADIERALLPHEKSS